MLWAKRRVRKGRQRQEQRRALTIHIEWLVLGEREGLQLSFGINHFSDLESRGYLRAQVRGNQVVESDFASVHMEAEAELHHHRHLERLSARHRLIGNV